jgi:hypothetical protein
MIKIHQVMHSMWINVVNNGLCFCPEKSVGKSKGFKLGGWGGLGVQGECKGSFLRIGTAPMI